MPDPSLSISPACRRVGALPPLTARTSTRIAGRAGIAVNRQDRETAEAAVSAAKTSATHPRARSGSARHRISGCAAPHGSSIQRRRRSPHARPGAPDRAKPRCRAGSLKGGFISTTSTLSGERPAAAKPARRRSTSSTMTSAAIAFAAALSRARSASAGSISTRTSLIPATRLASASPAAPTPAPKSTTRSPARPPSPPPATSASCPAR